MQLYEVPVQIVTKGIFRIEARNLAEAEFQIEENAAFGLQIQDEAISIDSVEAEYCNSQNALDWELTILQK